MRESDCHPLNPLGFNGSTARHLQEKYGLSVEAYNEMLDTQQNACAICKLPFYAVKPSFDSGAGVWVRVSNVDHDHTTKRVRGLLCTRCNRNLGWFEPLRDVVLSYLK